MTSSYEVVEYEPCSRYISRSWSGSDTGTRLFRADKAGTQVTYRLELEQEGIGALLAPLFSYILKRELDKDMAKAKSLLESGILNSPRNKDGLL